MRGTFIERGTTLLLPPVSGTGLIRRHMIGCADNGACRPGFTLFSRSPRMLGSHVREALRRRLSLTRLACRHHNPATLSLIAFRCIFIWTLL